MNSFFRKPFATLLLPALIAGCSSAENNEQQQTDGTADVSTDTPIDAPFDTPRDTRFDAPTDTPFSSAGALLVPDDLFQRDGYGVAEVTRIDVKTSTAPCVCSVDENSGCALSDVIGDTNIFDDFKPEIRVHMSGTNYLNDGSESNASLRQRGATARSAPQKSFRINLDGNVEKWRNEDRLQLNKHSFDQSRMRNKLSFDLMIGLDDLPSLRTQFVNLWIDDGQGPVDYGVFTHVEAVRKEFLKNRNWDTDSRLYKAEGLTFGTFELVQLKVDELGEPVSIDEFENVVEIKSGDDHRLLSEMITSLNDPSIPFKTTLERYFDDENVITWITVNLLFGQRDATLHNFYLYNPEGSQKFYFVPWDYDSALYFENDLIESYAPNDLLRRLRFGYARSANSVFLSSYLRQPGIHDRILAKADELRNAQLSNERITSLAEQHKATVWPFISKEPDAGQIRGGGRVITADRYDQLVGSLSGFVEQNYQGLRTDLGVPLPPLLETPSSDGTQLNIAWSPAFDVTGHSITYDIEIATSVAFDDQSTVLSLQGIADESERVSYQTPRANLPSSLLYIRITARTSADPSRFWQIAKNKVSVDGTEHYGVVVFDNQ